ncbi:hypothetical protein HZA87_03020 [Candidatus Uhrbacteria bacterium]|nr:hypothetical protein [Candidatus Uhrbacteria bacterium]
MLYPRKSIGVHGERESEQTAVNTRFENTLVDLKTIDTLHAVFGERLHPLLNKDGEQVRGTESTVYLIDGAGGSSSRVVKVLHRALPDWHVEYKNAMHRSLLEHLGEDDLRYPGYTMRNLPDGTTAVFQRFVPDEEKEHNFPLYAGNAEMRDDLSVSAYTRVSEGLVSLHDGYRYNRDEFLHVQGRGDLERTLKGAERNWELRVRLIGYVRGMMQFMLQNAELPDCASVDNLSVIYHNGELQIADIDGIHPNIQVFAHLPDALRRFPQRDGVASDKHILVSSLNTVRLLNGLATELGIPDRLNVVPPEMRQSKGIRWRIWNAIRHPTSLLEGQTAKEPIDFAVLLHQVRGGLGRPKKPVAA